MLAHTKHLVVCMLPVFLIGCASTKAPTYVVDTPAQKFSGLGSHTRVVTTTSPEAQTYFNQGLNWMYAFNHDEAIRSFKKAAELDPTCAMAWWGISYCEGPNYNDPIMTDARWQAAWDAMQSALANVEHVTPVERDLIEALQARYANPWPKDGSELKTAFGEAMAKVWAKHPNDSDVGTIYADSLMVKRPWMLYDLDFKPAEDTAEIESVLERVMAMDPTNPGAKHLYIHTVEPSGNPDRGIPVANQLGDLVPASGHLRHMPAHIYVKTGLWNQAIVQSVKAMQADDAYQKRSPKQTIQWLYMVHNSHMLAFAAMMTGREEAAMAAARDMWSDIPAEDLERVGPIFDFWMCSVFDVQKRFGRWDDIIAEPAPPKYLPITRASWRAARAVAYAAKKDFKNAEREYRKFNHCRNKVPQDAYWGGPDLAINVLKVADHFIAGEIALQKGNWEDAAEHLEEAAKIEDTLSYGEPPQWLQPVRHTLGAVYLKSGNFAEAERVYREDLAEWRENGWSLYGLTQALKAQGKTAEAAKFEHRFNSVWQYADAPIDTSCKCIPSI
ncbi:MAG: hypothetical protein DHS20C16_07380 [Phycisphaerae bacterium]|nr:MAG: hypothetical protein DHS20C16_07380 [Phycisphaerae bacterium]